jgi:two-component system, cell cycle sensor histidine kinase and response regulator CckA
MWGFAARLALPVQLGEPWLGSSGARCAGSRQAPGAYPAEPGSRAPSGALWLAGPLLLLVGRGSRKPRRDRCAELERELAEATELLRESQRVSRVGSYVFDIPGNSWSSSAMLDELFGIQPDYVKTLESWAEIIHPDDRERMVRYVVEEVVGKRERFDTFYRIVRLSDQKTRWVHGLGELVIGEDGAVTRMIGTIQDVTEQKVAEDEVRLARERLEATLDALPDLLFEVDAKGTIFDYRAPAPEKLYVSPDLFLGKAFRDVLPAPVAAVIEAAIGDAARSGHHYGTTYPLELRGETRWFELSAAARGRAGERDSRYVMLVRDISERKRAEEALRESEETFRQLIEQAADGIFILDPDGRFLLANSRLCAMLGYKQEEMLALGVLATYPDEDREEGRQRLGSLRSGTALTFERLMKRKDGSLVPVEASAARLPDGRLQAIVRDISERRRLEAQLRQSQKMEAVGKLAGGVAHDFNNILTAMLGHLELGLLKLPRDHPVRADLEESQKATERAAALTRQLLAFARRQVIEPRVVNLNDLVANLGKMLGRLIGEDIELVTALDPALGRVRVDPGQIEQVLMNLTVNARDAMPEGGRLTIASTNLVLSEADARHYVNLPAGEYAVVRVSDTGSGMSDDAKAHAFEPFFTTKALGQGTGLGLATCFGIVQQAQGHIGFESEVGKGTTFSVLLPRVVEAVDNPDAQRAQAPLPRGTETVLLAEDEPALRRLMSSVLREHGYTVLEAADGLEALALVSEHRASLDLVVTDVVMPGVSGHVIADRVVALSPRTRILLVSGYLGSPLVREAAGRYADSFLQKPFTPSELCLRVRELLDRSPGQAVEKP